MYFNAAYIKSVSLERFVWSKKFNDAAGTLTPRESDRFE
jgi:hypothetical protein